MSEAMTTSNHATIRTWAEDRGGRPSKVKGAQTGGVLRIDFGEPEEALEEISWDEFFAIFDDRKLTFLHQDKMADGKVSRFNKFIDRE